MQTLNLKNTAIICSIAFGFLFVFAFYFYFERLNSDAGYYFFQTVNSQKLHVEHGRFVLILAECFIWLAAIAHLPLKIIGILYSINHVLLFAFLVWVCLKRFDHKNAAVLITLMQFIGLRYSVFTPQFELYYGLSLLLFTMAYLQFLDTKNTPINWRNQLLTWVLLVFVFTSHPMAIYCSITAFALFFLNKSHRGLWLKTLVVLLAYILWKKIAVSEYEKSKFDGFGYAFFNHLNHFYNLSFLKQCLQFLCSYYWDCLLLMIVGIASLLMLKKYKKTLLYVSSILVALLIIWLMFPPNGMGRYIEQVYFPFVFLCGLWLYQTTINSRLMLVLLIMMLIRAYGMVHCGLENKKRTEQIAQFIDQAQHKTGTKFYVTEQDMGDDLYDKGNWSYGFETLLYASMHAKKTVSITKDEDLDYNGNRSRLKPNDFLFRPFEIIPYSELNRYYFNLDESDYQALFVP